MIDERLVARAWTRDHGEDHPTSAAGPGPSSVGRILVVNAGSTSLKLSLVADESSEAVGSLAQVGTDDLDAVAHRVVHGGSRFRAPDDRRDGYASARRSAAWRNWPRSTTPPQSGASTTRWRRSRSPARRRLRHRVPRHHPGRGGDIRRAAGVAEHWGSAATGSTASPSSGRPSAWAPGVSSSAISAAAAR